MSFEKYDYKTVYSYSRTPFICVSKIGYLCFSIAAATKIKEWEYMNVQYNPQTKTMRLVKCKSTTKGALKISRHWNRRYRANYTHLKTTGALRYWNILPKKSYRVLFTQKKNSIFFKIKKNA